MLTSQVLRRLGRRSLRRNIRLRHTAIDHEVAAVHEARLVARQEEHSLSLLDGLSEPSSWEVHLTPVPLLLIVTKPVLQERRIERSRAESVEAEALTRVDDCELAGHGQHGALGGCVRELRGGGADESDDRGGVDDAAALLGVLAHGEDGVLAAEPDALDVDVLGQVPDLLGGVDGV